MRGLLAVSTSPRPEYEEEFNAWYDTEHMQERLSIPGFISARRWVSTTADNGGPHKYLATYELVSPEVLASAHYRKHIGDGQTPWGKRVLSKLASFHRWACAQLSPGDALPRPEASALFLSARDVAPPHEQEFNRWYEDEHLPTLSALPGVLSARRFVDEQPAPGHPRFLALYELSDAALPESAPWRAAASTPWAKKIVPLTQGYPSVRMTYTAFGLTLWP